MREYFNYRLTLLVFSVLNILLCFLLLVTGVVNIVNTHSSSIIVYNAYTIIISTVMIVSEFQIPEFVMEYMKFLLTFKGRALFYTFFGCLLYSKSLFNIISSLTVVTAGIALFLISWTDLLPPEFGLIYNFSMWMDFTDIKDSVVGNGVKKGGSGNYSESMVPKSDSITQRSVRSERAIDRRTDMDPEVFDYQTYRGSYDENVGCISRHFYKNANANETVAIDTRRDAYFLNTMGDKLGKTFPGEHIGTGNAVNYHRFGGILRNSSVPGANLQDSNKRINRLQPIDLSEETTQLYGTYEAHGSYHVNTYNKSITQHTRDILEYKGVDNFIDKSGSDERKTADSYAVGLDKSELCLENVTGSLMANKDNGLVKFASQKAVALHNHAYTERTGDLMEDKASSLLHNERSPSSPFLSGQSTRVFEEKATHTKEPENDKVLNKRNELSRASIPLWHEEMAIPEGERVQFDSVQNTIGRHNQEDSYNTLGSLHSTMNENGISNGTHSLYGSSSPPRTKCYEPYSNGGLLSQLSIISGELDSELPNH